ncbi:glycosyltransferase family 4 protein [Photobacterium leiognathi]|uniref:glycosyltransferase family 4 protein n=1 Tax=Photobacterium leiognathi TaxID=553611 RepID=UPI00298167E9|nr:glycosyltransferase family 4 protein [Photobacterium leiognathi]
MQKNKIGIFLPYAENYDSHYGGAIARWCHETLSRNLDKYHFSVYSASGDKGYPEGYKTNIYGKYISFIKNKERKYAKNLLWAKIFYQIKRFTCRDSFLLFSLFNEIKKNDIVIIHNRPKLVSFLRRLGFDKKIFLHLHNSHLANLAINEINDTIYHSDKIFYCSDFLKTEVEDKLNKNNNKNIVIYNGCKNISDSNFFEPREKVILFSGRFIDDKGILELIDGFNLLKGSYELHLAGGVSSGIDNATSPYYEKIKNKIKGNDKIKNIGYLDHDLLLKKMRESEIFIMPSKWKEPFGMVALEAYLSGCKVISSKNGGAKEFLLLDAVYCDCEPKSIFKAIVKSIDIKNYVPSNDMGYFSWDNIAEKFSNELDDD